MEGERDAESRFTLFLWHVHITYMHFKKKNFLPGHRLRPGELPREASGVHLGLPERHGVRRGQHPLPEGGVRSVSFTRGRKLPHWVVATTWKRKL